MSYLIRLSDKRPDGAIVSAVQQAVALAESLFQPEKFEGEWSKGGLAITSLHPRHVAATNQATGLQGAVAGSAAWGVTAATASTWTSWIDLNIDDRAFQVVTGIMNLSPNPRITSIKPVLNGQDLPVISIDEMYTWDLARAYFSQPYIITPANRHTVKVLSSVTLAGIPSEQIGLLGYTIGRRAYLISES